MLLASKKKKKKVKLINKEAVKSIQKDLEVLYLKINTHTYSELDTEREIGKNRVLGKN